MSNSENPDKVSAKKPLIDEEKKKAWKRRIPVLSVSVLALLTLYFSFWGLLKIVSLGMSHYHGEEVYILPLLVGKFNGVHLLAIPIVASISIYGWLLSTRVIQFKKPFFRILFFFNMIFANASFVTAYGMTKIQDYVLPYFYERIGRVIDTGEAVDQVLFSQTQGFFFMLEMIPLIGLAFIGVFVLTKYRQHDNDFIKSFFEFQWSGEWLRKFENLGKIEDAIIEYPDVELGINRKTNEMVVLPGFDRTLNTVITGSIGTGKTAALAKPIINQDLHYFTRFMNMFPEISKKKNYISKAIQGRFLNGLSVIEPSNDLCKDVFQLAKAHGIPDSAITYIDPTNPKTVNLNPMKGPTDKVAEVFAQVMAGLADSGGGGGNFFFVQAERAHLKNYIYLLKEYDPTVEVTFDKLLDMYDDTSLVREMHIKLKERFPKGFEKIKERDEYNYWQILKALDKWFDNNLVAKEEWTNQGNRKVYGDNGQPVFEDVQAKFVQGLRNVLTDIGNNPLIRRVLFGKSSFDFDEHMGSAGGILLVNTAKGDLSDLSAVLGKIVLISLQNATFRRAANTSAFHHVLVDEAPEYLYSSFAKFPTQSRKYKVIITILQQTLTQLRGAFGEDYMNTVVAAMRNRMVYADVSNFDGQYFQGMFGEKEVYQEGESEQSVSPLQENPISRSGSSYSKVKEAAMSASDILFQDEFECAVKIVVNNKSMPVQQIKANFVPEEEFEEAVIKVIPESAEVWERARFGDDYLLVVESAKDTIEQVEDVVGDTTTEEYIDVLIPSLDDKQVDKAISATVSEKGTIQQDEVPYISKEEVPHIHKKATLQYESQFGTLPKEPIEKEVKKASPSAIKQQVPDKSTPAIQEHTKKTQPLQTVTVPKRSVNYNKVQPKEVKEEKAIEPLKEIAAIQTQPRKKDGNQKIKENPVKVQLPEVSFGKTKNVSKSIETNKLDITAMEDEKVDSVYSEMSQEQSTETIATKKRKKSLTSMVTTYQEAEIDPQTSEFLDHLQESVKNNN